MAQPVETFDSYDAVGNREDLADIIYNISPVETPFQMYSGRGRASSRIHEWQTDELATAVFNAAIEGDDSVGDAIAKTIRLGNFSNISDKIIVISGTQEVVDKAGRKSELAYQLAKKGKELKRDIEVTLTGNTAALVGDATTARNLGSLEAWYGTAGGPADTTLRGAGGADGILANGIPTTAATNGAQRALTESLTKNVIQAVWTNGGDANVLMCGPFNKTVISAFTGNSTRFDKGEDKMLVTAIDIYVSDFGSHRVVPNRFSRERTLHVLTSRLWSVDYLRNFRQIPLSKTGDNERRLLLAEYTLRASNASGSGVVADITTS